MKIIINEPKIKSLFNIGNNVKIKDGSNNKDLDTGKNRYGIDPLFNNTAKVIKNNLLKLTNLKTN